MYVYYVQLLYIYIMLNKIHKHVKNIYIRDQKENKFFCEDENISF